MRTLHLSDTHLFGDPAARHYDRIDTRAALLGLLARLRAADLGPLDAVVHTGDASEDGTEASYRLLHEILDPAAAALGAPLVVAMGNHDSSAAYAAVRGPGDAGTERQDRVHLTPDGLRLITLDTSVPGAGYGQLTAAQLVWLREVLAETAASPRGTVLALHHPPLQGATRLLRALDLAAPSREGLTAALRGSDVRLVLAGHYHHAMDGEIAGIPVHVAPGITNVVDPLAPDGQEQAFALSGASLLELPEGAAGERGTAPRVLSTVVPSAGDARPGAEPVYTLDAAQVDRIIAAAGAPDGAPEPGSD